MKTLILSIIILLAGAISAIDVANAQISPSNEVTEQMQKFNWMTGDWEGEAWYLDRNQNKVTIVQNEHIIYRLDGAIITMEGTGSDIPSGKQKSNVVFRAFGILTYDIGNSKFVFRAYQAGNFIDTEFKENPDGSFNWGFDASYGKTRYTTRLTPDGKWNEIGEFSQDGKNWNKNFEMTLTKK